eukprot:7056282-Pyramimonas_sp.AAC.1
MTRLAIVRQTGYRGAHRYEIDLAGSALAVVETSTRPRARLTPRVAQREAQGQDGLSRRVRLPGGTASNERPIAVVGAMSASKEALASTSGTG